MVPMDTSPEAARLQLAIQRQLGPAGRLALAIEMCEAVRACVEAGIRKRHPGFSGDQVRKELLRHLYGVDLDSPCA